MHSPQLPQESHRRPWLYDVIKQDGQALPKLVRMRAGREAVTWVIGIRHRRAQRVCFHREGGR